LRKLVKVFEEEDIDYMFIGGFALPAYGEIRATQDVDVAVAVTKLKTLRELFNALATQNFEPVAEPMLEAPVSYFLDRENMVDVEIWLRPDGVRLDEEVLKRRQRRKLPDLDIWVIGPEDFIVNKLSRRDRRARDENDVVSVLLGQKEKLDKEYLEERAREFGVFQLLQVLEGKLEKASKS
jgi:hypothetical protein